MRILGTPDPKGWRVIEGIKAIRNGCGINLKDAKKLLDRARAGEEVLLPVRPENAVIMHRTLDELGVTMEPLVTNDTLKEVVAEVNDEAMFADGLEGALVGWVERFGMGPVALYDKAKVLELLMDDMECPEAEPCDGIDNGTCEHIWEMAEEHYSFNILGAWCGDSTPAFAMILRKA